MSSNIDGKTDATSQVRRRSRGVVAEAVPIGLAIVAEAAWISAVAGLFQEYVLRDPTLTIPELASFVLAGTLASRFLTNRFGERWPPAAMALVIGAALAGLFASPEARAAIEAGGIGAIGQAIAVHPGGVLAGLAVLRGFGHAYLARDEDRLGRLFGGGLVAIALTAIAGGLVTEPWRAHFLAQVLVASVVFASTATLALALTRQNLVGLDSGIDWRRNPAWVALLVVLVTLVATLAVPAAMVAPRAVDLAIELAIGLALGPLVLIGLIAGWTRRAAWILLLALVVDGVAIIVAPLFGGPAKPRPVPAAPTPVTDTTTPPTDQGVLLIGVGLLTLLALISIVLLVRLWMRQAAGQAADVDEIRTIDRGERSVSRTWRPRRLGFRPAPHDAVSAYRALVDDLAPRAVVRRDASETPAEHASRLRAAGLAGLGLDLLAADYALVRFGGISLSEREDRRAVARWRALRGHLKGAPPAPERPAGRPARARGMPPPPD